LLIKDLRRGGRRGFDVSPYLPTLYALKDFMIFFLDNADTYGMLDEKGESMSDSERQVREFVRNMETVKLSRWMVNMQNLASRLRDNAKGFPLLCVSCAAGELLIRYRANKNDAHLTS